MANIVQQDSHIFPSSFHLLNTGNDTVYLTPWYLSIPFQFCPHQSKHLELSLSKNIHHLFPFRSPIYYSSYIPYIQPIYIVSSSHTGKESAMPPTPSEAGWCTQKEEETGCMPLTQHPQTIWLTPTIRMGHTVNLFCFRFTSNSREESVSNVMLWDSIDMWGGGRGIRGRGRIRREEREGLC